MSRRCVVIGHGMVGARLADEVRRRDPNGVRVRLTVLGAEPYPAYNRVLLSTVLAGGLSARSVELHPTGWAARKRIDLRTGVTATAIDRDRRVVHCSDGNAEPYDELVLATGSRAWMPPMPGLDDGSVTAFRDLADCERILALARPGTRFAVLGGGLLGCEAARGLAGRGVRVSLLHAMGHLMERQLDAGAGHVLAAALCRLGVDVRLGVAATSWQPGIGVRCSDDSLIAADALVVATGVRAETGLASAAGIAVDSGVLVDDRLATSDDRVHAIGDCAQHPSAMAGLVQSGWDQAAALADLLTGSNPAARYRGTSSVTRLKARDIDLATVGEPDTGAEAGTEVLQFSDPARVRTLPVAGHWLEVRGHAVLVDGALQSVPPAGMALIRALAHRPGRVVTRADLLRALPGGGDDEHAVETAMARLRTALGEPKLVQTIVKRGYRLALDPLTGPTAAGHCLDGDAL